MGEGGWVGVGEGGWGGQCRQVSMGEGGDFARRSGIRVFVFKTISSSVLQVVKNDYGCDLCRPSICIWGVLIIVSYGHDHLFRSRDCV